MKRVFGILCLVAAVAVLATSCKKEDEKKNSSFEVSFGETKGFVAGPSFDGSKAYILPTNGQFRWSDGDEIMVYNLASDYTQSVAEVYSATGCQGATTTTFHGEPVGDKKDLGFRIFYHASKASGNLQAGNRETFTVSATQNYDGASYIDPTALVMATEVQNNNANNFVLQHIFGILNVGIADNVGGKKVNNIVVEDDVFNLTGTMSVKLPEVNANTLSGLMQQCESTNASDAYLTALNSYLQTLGYESNGNGKTITLNCNYDLPYMAWQYFFIPVRPGAFYKGYTITINYADGTSQSHHFDAGMGNLIKPATILNTWWLTDSGFYM